MKVCIITPIFPPDIGGPATYTYELVKRLKNYKIFIITLTESPIIIDNEVISIKSTINTPIIKSLIKFIKLFSWLVVRRNQYDIAYIQTPDPFGFAALLVLKLLGKPTILKFVGDIAWEFAYNTRRTERFLDDFLHKPDGGIPVKLLMFLQKVVFKKVDVIITPSRYLKNILTAFYNVEPAKIEVIYNAVEFVELKNNKINKKNSIKLICTIGRLIPSKGIDKIIEIMPRILRKYPESKLLIIGDGPDKKRLKDIAEKKGVDNHVVFLGKLKHKDVIKILKSSNLFVLNSKYEGLPHTVIEAMTLKVPVVATAVGGTVEVARNFETGLLVKPYDTKDLVGKIIYALDNEKDMRKIARRAHKMIKHNFSWEYNLKKLENVLNRVTR